MGTFEKGEKDVVIIVEIGVNIGGAGMENSASVGIKDDFVA